MTIRHEAPSMDSILEKAVAASRNGDLETLKALLETESRVLELRDEEGHSLLGLACHAATGNSALPPVPGELGQHAAVDLILQAGADPSVATHDGWAPLHTAAKTGHLELAKRLLAAGAPLQGSLMGCQGGSPLSLALFYAQTDMAKVLAHPPFPDNLRTAAALGESLDRFLCDGALTPEAIQGLDFYRPIAAFPVWERSYDRQEVLDEALTWAARNGQCESLDSLVALGAQVNANAYRGTPLLWAIYGDRVAAATWLLDHGADPDLPHDFGGEGHGCGAVAMHLAAQYNSLGCLQLLLDRGADSGLRDQAFGGSPAGWARHSGAQAALDILNRV